MGGKEAKAWSLARFCELASSGGSDGAPCLPKIYHGGPDSILLNKSISKKYLGKIKTVGYNGASRVVI